MMAGWGCSPLLEDFLDTLERNTGKRPSGSDGSFHSPCPAHEDDSLRLIIREGRDGRPFCECLAGCSAEEIFLSIRWSEESARDRVRLKIGGVQFFDIAALMRDPSPSRRGEVLGRSDGEALFRYGTIGLLIGHPGAGKSWITLEALRQEVFKGNLVFVLDWEGSAERFVERLGQLGMSPEDAQLIQYGNPGMAGLAGLADGLARLAPSLVVIDSAAKCYAAHGLNEDLAGDALQLFGALAQPLARAGSTVLIVDHLVKTQGPGVWPRGSGAKLADVDTAFSVEPVEPFGRGRSGKAKLKVVKDRDAIMGSVGDVAAIVYFEAMNPAGQVRLRLEPMGMQGAESEVALSPAHRRVLAVVEASHVPVSVYEIQDRVANDGGKPIRPRTVQDACQKLRKAGLVALIDDEVPHRWVSSRAEVSDVPSVHAEGADAA
jgi:hypothetical protein